MPPVTAQAIILAAAYVLALGLLTCNGILAFLNWRSSSILSESKTARTRVGSLESSLKEVVGRVESLDGRYLSLHRKFNKAKFDGQLSSSDSPNNSTSSSDDLAHLTPQERALFGPPLDPEDIQ